MCSIAFPKESTNSTTARPSQDAPRIRCTGPRTADGKKRSSQNARKHSLSATTPPPDLLQNPTYQILRKELIEEFHPTTPMLKILVDQLTFISWKLDQIPKLEHHLLATPLGETTPAPLPATPEESPADYLTRRLTEDPAEPPPPTDPTNELTALHLLQDKPTPLTRLWDHHRRLLGRCQSLIRQIQQLKKQYQSIRDANEKEDRQRRQQDDAMFTEYVDAMRNRHRAEAEEAQRRYQRAAQNELPPATPTPTPAKAPAQNELPSPNPLCDLRVSAATSPSAPEQNELPPRPSQSAIGNPQSEIHTPPPPIAAWSPPVTTSNVPALPPFSVVLPQRR